MVDEVDWSRFAPAPRAPSRGLDDLQPRAQPATAAAPAVDWSRFAPAETVATEAKPPEDDDGLNRFEGKKALKLGTLQGVKAFGKAIEGAAVNLGERMTRGLRALAERGAIPAMEGDTDLEQYSGNPFALMLAAPSIGMKALGTDTTAFAERVIAENPEWQEAAVIANQPWTELLAKPKAAGTALALNAPNLAGSLLGSIAGGLVTGNRKGAIAGGAATSYLLESGHSFDELEELAGSPEDAARTAAAVGTVNALLDTLSIGRLIEATPLLRKAFGETITTQLAKRPAWRRMLTEGLKQATAEGSTEGLQQVISNLGKAVYDEHQDLFEGVPESMFIGTLLGGGTGTVAGAVPVPAEATTASTTDNDLDGVDVRAADAAETLRSQRFDDPDPAQLADRSGDIQVDPSGTAATAAMRADFEASRAPKTEAPALPAPRTIVDAEGGAGTQSQREQYETATGATPDVRRAGKQHPGAAAPPINNESPETAVDTSGTREAAPAAAPAPTESASDTPPTFASPAELRKQDFATRAREQGLTPEQTEALRPAEQPDTVTGFYKAEDRVPTLKRAQAWTAQTGAPVIYVEMDFANLGGLNAKRGHSGANQFYRATADIVREELEAVAPATIPFRHGGDEMSAVVPGVDHDTVRAAVAEAQRRVAQLAEAEGLADVPHTKRGGRPGVGLYFGTAQIGPDTSLDDVFSTADLEVETAKSESRDVNGNPTQPSRPAAPQGQAGAAAGGVAETPRRSAPARAAERLAAEGGAETVTSPVDAAAAEAATSPANNLPEPTDAQKEAGNYRKGKLNLHGLDISIENPKGSRRRPEWPPLAHHYGDIKRTTGRDGDNIDVFLGPGAEDPSLPVFVIDQENPSRKPRRFDEHKVMLGFPDEAAAREGYLANYTKGWQVGPITRMSLDEFKAWLKTADLKKRAATTFKPAATTTLAKKMPKAQAKRAPTRMVERIEDFGETLHGARKHLWEGFRERLDAVGDNEIAQEPLSKIWPEPNYEKLLDDGADPWVVAFVRAARDEIPAKPRAHWKLRRWAEQVQLLRKVAKQLLDGDIAAATVRAKLDSAEYEQLARYLGGRIELYQAVGHEQSLKGVRLEKHAYSFYEGQKHDPPKTVWSVEKPAKASAFSNWPRTLATGDTKAEAIAAFKKNLAGVDVDKPAKKHVRFDLFGIGGKYVIGKKIRRHLVRLKEFDDLQEARAYLQENQDELVRLYEQAKDVPSMRGEENGPRVGIDHRNGADVTPELFADAFGFRGVQFGNYVEGARRQHDLNEAYDALMDLAGVLGVPSRALSLNGELGLAFGARGKGGINAAAAHYEPGNVVINLTKRGGPGSLAHEWWHALDNYFSRARREKAGFLTERPYQTGAGIRPEMVAAFNKITEAMRDSGMLKRARRLDQLRSKDYWSTMAELSARAFEAYAVAKLQDQGLANDYLANITTPDVWGEARDVAEDFPYPFLDEMPTIRAAYDNFFEVVETREEEGGRVAMFSRQAPKLDPQRAVPVTTLRGDEIAAGALTTQEAKQYAKANLQGKTFHNDDSGFDILVSHNGIGKAFRHATPEIMRSLPALPELLRTAVLAESEAHRGERPELRAAHYFYAPLSIDGELYRARLVVMETNMGQRYYDHRLTRIEKPEASFRGAASEETSADPRTSASGSKEPDVVIRGDGRSRGSILRPSGSTITLGHLLAGVKDSRGEPYVKTDVRRRVTGGTEARPRAGLSASEVQKVVDRLAKSWKNAPEMRVVQGERDLPAIFWQALHSTGSENTVNGLFDTATGRIYLIADALASPAEAERVLFHEALGHFGLRQLLGDDLVPVLNQVVLKYGKSGLADIARIEGLDLNKKADRLIAAEEKLAHLAETGADPTLLQALAAVIRRWLRRVGLKLELSYAEILEIVAKARRAVVYGKHVPRSARAEPAPAMASRVRFHRSEPPRPFPDGFTTPADSVIDVVRQKLQDKYIDLRRVQEAIEEERVIDDAANAYMAEELYHGKAEQDIEEARDATMKPLLDAIHAAGLTVEQAGEYLYARHAKERNARIQAINPKFQEAGGGSGMTDAEADAILKQYKGNKAVEEIGRIVDGITKKHRDLLVASGLEKQETVEAWSKMYEHYVPLKGRADLEDTNIRAKTGKGFDVRGRAKRAFGRKSEAENIVANLLAQYEADLIRAQKAEVGRSLLRLVEANPNEALWEIDKVVHSPRIDPRTGLVVYGHDPSYQLADNVLVVKVDGVDHHITFHGERGKRIAGAMKNLGAANAAGPVRVLAALNRVLATVNTSLNPEFVISNIIRDLQTAGINLAGTEADAVKGAIIRDVGKAWHGIREAQKGRISGEWAKHFQAFRKAGGKTGWIDAHNDVNRLHKQLEKELKAYQRNPKHPLSVMKAIGEFVEAENTAVENAVRLSAFVHAKRMGATDAKAASLAKNLTVNFNRKGEWGVVANALYLFYNASVQGNIRMLQALRSKKVQKIVGGIVVFAAMLDVLNRMLGGDDEDGVPKYDKIPPWVKERNLIIMDPFQLAEDGYFKIPLPWGYNVFHVLGQEIGTGISAAFGQYPDYDATEGAVRVVSTVANAFNPLGSDATIGQLIAPTFYDPIASVDSNLDWAGRPIRPGENPFADAPKPDSQKYWNSTSEIAKDITRELNDLMGGSEVRPAEWGDVSPTTLEYLFEFATGGAGRFIGNLVDIPLKLAVDDEIETYKIPFVRKLYGTIGTQATQELFYENLEQIHYADKELKLAVEDRDLELRQRTWDQYGGYLRARMMADATEKQLRNLREQRDRIRASQLPEKAQRDRVKIIEERMEAIMLRFNKRVRELRKAD